MSHPDKVKKGDRARIVIPDSMEHIWGKEIVVVINAVKDDEDPYWIFTSEETGKSYIWEIPIILEILPDLDP